MSLLEHAKRELEIAFPPKADEESNEMQALINEDILAVVETFSKQGHSGSSAAYAIPIISKLLNFEVLKPLTGDEDEWNDVMQYGGGMYKQNKRCSHVFKDEDGRTYNIRGKVFKNQNGAYYTDSDSSVDITFPYTPKTEYIDKDDEIEE